MTTDIRPRGFFTQHFAGSDGSTVALCTYHLRMRQMLGQIEYEVMKDSPSPFEPSMPCADCVERERVQGDAYSLPLASHYESLAGNCDVIWYALTDMLSTLEIAADKMQESAHVEAIERLQKKLRPMLDTELNERWCIAARFNEMLDDEGNEIVIESEYDEENN